MTRHDHVHPLRKPPIVEGIPVSQVACPECLAMTVIEAYRRLNVRLLFCTSCERTWTEE